LQLEYNIQQVLEGYKEPIKKMRPKKVLMLPGVVLKQEDVPEFLEQHKQKNYR
jgi:hypothetical protein